MSRENNIDNTHSAYDNSQSYEKKIINLVGNALKVMKEFPSTVQKSKHNLSVVYEAISGLLNCNAEELVENFSNYKTKVEEGVFIWGNAGWCLYGCSYDVPEAILPILSEICKETKNNSDSTYDNTKLNLEAMYYLKESNAIDNSIDNLKCNLSEDDIGKFNNALDDFKNKKYYNCASMLCGIIDSLSIKQCTHDISIGKINNTDKVSQGWLSFQKVMKYNYNIISLSVARNDNKNRKNIIEQRMIDNSIAFCDYWGICAVYNLILCMLRLFYDTDFKEYETNKPTIINRNWISHGMYNLNDINETDCIKLILILDQLSRLYMRLNGDEVPKKEE